MRGALAAGGVPSVGPQLLDPAQTPRLMVTITDPFRAQWEARDEYRKIAAQEWSEEWLPWFLGAEAAGQLNGTPIAHPDRDAFTVSSSESHSRI